MRSRKNEPDQWIDVEWDPRTTRLFQAAINVTVENQRGVLARVASEIADAGSNIDAISMDEDRGALHHHALRARGGEPPAPRARHARAAAPAGRQEDFPNEGIAGFVILSSSGRLGVDIFSVPFEYKVRSVRGSRHGQCTGVRQRRR